jgi:hypothetical protein
LNVADDFLELLKALAGRGAECVIVGGYALAFHGHPRYTGDLDIWSGLPVFFISRESLLRNKKAVGRPQDLLGVETLQKLPPPRDRK